ncbi:hypothetical protein LUZ63_011998 [Rhynchospora breviuscula]|uniref:O-methyltransferase n=1 Tax=Rhynchospora breviuscula TaxID=2022672 RepID=A0A9Q0CK87_9POAL|nr:hypothetical protein LUZ63_011998 [Rhynchospora breviuscula]
MSLKCALDLGIPDAIFNNGQPMSLSQLHSVLSLPPSKKSHLYRLMRLLTHNGFFIEKSAGACSDPIYDLTAQSRLVIQKNESANMLPYVCFSLDNIYLKSSLHMGDWFMQDSKQNPFELANGSTVWEIASQEPVVNKMFNDGMVSSSCLFNDYSVEYGDEIFRGIESLVDVGGGKGAMAEVIAKNFPHVRCTVLDLPHVICDNPNDGIIKFVPGDMFNYIPPADAVLLKWVLHDWSHGFKTWRFNSESARVDSDSGANDPIFGELVRIWVERLEITINGENPSFRSESSEFFRVIRFDSCDQRSESESDSEFQNHDWSNEDCIRILRRCKDAIPSREAGGKVIVLEAVVGSTSAMISEEPLLLLDMLMLTVAEGGERDENGWKYLFTEAGYSSYKITNTIGFLSIIEVYP